MNDDKLSVIETADMPMRLHVKAAGSGGIRRNTLVRDGVRSPAHLGEARDAFLSNKQVRLY